MKHRVRRADRLLHTHTHTQAGLPSPLSFNASAIPAKLQADAALAKLAARKTATAGAAAKQTLVNAAVIDKAAGLDPLTRQAKAATGPGFGAFKGKSVVVFITDQETNTLDYMPPGWEAANLPGKTRLLENGIEFKRAYTNACMCTAARATLWSGFLTTQNNACWVLETPMPADQYPQRDLPDDLPNLATVKKEGGGGGGSCTRPSRANPQSFPFFIPPGGQGGGIRGRLQGQAALVQAR